MSRDKLIGLDHWLTTEPDWNADMEPPSEEDEMHQWIDDQQQQWEHEMVTTRLDKRAAHLKPGETKDQWSDDLLWALYCAIWDAEDEGYGRSAMTQDGLRKALEYHGLKLNWIDKSRAARAYMEGKDKP